MKDGPRPVPEPHPVRCLDGQEVCCCCCWKLIPGVAIRDIERVILLLLLLMMPLMPPVALPTLPPAARMLSNAAAASAAAAAAVICLQESASEDGRGSGALYHIPLYRVLLSCRYVRCREA